MSTGARAATVASSRDLKQKLVNLLFREKYKRTEPQGYDRLDFSIYSYEELRKAYLERVQVIHPDKIKSNNSYTDDNERYQSQRFDVEGDKKEKFKQEFQELQSTWNRYEELFKGMMKNQGDGAAANFTQFGVGCSFSDNEEERILRTAITDQACRGWFSSGLVSSGLEKNDIQERGEGNEKLDENISTTLPSLRGMNPKQNLPLIDDKMFVQTEACDTSRGSDASNGITKSNSSSPYRRTLIPKFK